MGKRALSLSLAASCLLGACATPKIWDKPGSTQAEFNKDSYECERDARQSGGFGGGIAGSLNMRDFFGRCMVARGWTARN